MRRKLRKKDRRPQGDNGEVKRSDWWARVLAVGSLIVSIIVAYLSCEQWKFTEEQAERSRSTRLAIDAEWNTEEFYWSGFVRRAVNYRVVDGELAWDERIEGLALYLLVKISNNSEHDISIDEVSVKFEYGPLGRDGIRSSECFKSPGETRFRDALRVEARGQGRIYVRIPVYLDTALGRALKELKSGNDHPADEFVQYYQSTRGFYRPGESPVEIFRKALWEYIMPLPQMGGNEYGDLQVFVRLATGEEFLKTITLSELLFDYKIPNIP